MSSSKPINISILGSGLIGSFIGGCLLSQSPKLNISLIGRARFIEHIQKTGLQISLLNSNKYSYNAEHVTLATHISQVEKSNIVFLCVKSQDTESATKEIVPYINENTIVVSFQNGIRNTEVLRKLLPQNEIIGGIIPFNVICSLPSHYMQTSSGDIMLEKSRSTRFVKQILSASQLPTREEDNILAMQWTKLLMNLNNPINALAGIPLKQQLQHRGYRLVTAACIDEALKILDLNNIKPKRYGKIVPSILPLILRLPTPIFNIIAKSLININPLARSSMYEDLTQKKLTEIDYLNGEIEFLGRRSGVASPINNKIISLIKAAEQLQQGSPNIRAEDLLNQIRAQPSTPTN